MSDTPTPAAGDLFTEMLRIQGEAARQMMATVMPEAVAALPGDEDLTQWGEATLRLQKMWLDFHEQQSVPEMPVPLFVDPAQWLGMMQGWYQQMPWLDPARQQQLVADGMALWEDVLAQYGIGPKAHEDKTPEVDLPRADRRFADAAWREQPVFALIHQTYRSRCSR
jgi:polyhydroxyalkanoate synthase subunit PhaC